MSSRPTLSVVIPVCNEQEVLPELARQLREVLDRSGETWEIVLVNDGSRDRSWEILQGLRAADDRMTLVNLSRNFGHQIAITAGMHHALGDAVVVMDADLQDPPEVVLTMLERWREGYDVVFGVREHRDESIFKRAPAAVFYRVMSALSPIAIPLDAGDFRLMSRRAVTALSSMPERARFVRGMVAWIGFRQIDVKYRRQARLAGHTKYPLRKMLLFAADGLVSFSHVPLRLAIALGMVTVVAAMSYFAWAVVAKLVLGHTVPGWASIVATVLLMGSAQLICLGIIGEYVGRIAEEVKARPLFLVEAVQQGPAKGSG